ncbi:hypothetical protein GCM10009730_68110 [Streptomyces albidochromogenes]
MAWRLGGSTTRDPHALTAPPRPRPTERTRMRNRAFVTARRFQVPLLREGVAHHPLTPATSL